MDASTLMVVFLLASAASLASYLKLPASEASPQKISTATNIYSLRPSIQVFGVKYGGRQHVIRRCQIRGGRSDTDGR